MNYRDCKIVQALHYLMSNVADASCDKVHLLKLVYLADRYHLRKYGSAMISNAYCAYPNGPVNQNVYDVLKRSDDTTCTDFGDYFYTIPAKSAGEHTHYKTAGKIAYTCLSETNLEALKVAVDKMADLSSKGVDLSDYSHRFKEWQNVEGLIDEKNNVHPRIKIADFFLPTDDPGDEYCLGISDELIQFNREIAVEG